MKFGFSGSNFCFHNKLAAELLTKSRTIEVILKVDHEI
jgi:hypothetical protein